MKITFWNFLAGLLISLLPGEAFTQDNTLTPYGKLALEESAIPVRPGVPGKTPFWNQHARRFIYSPAFNFKTLDKAVKYQYELVSEANGKTYTFEHKVPYAPLSPVWASVPVGYFTLKVTGLSATGEVLGLAGEVRKYRAAPFNGVYHQPVMPYDKSAQVALDKLMHQDYVSYWLAHKAPDPDYPLYRYPAKIFSALIIGAITHARLKPNTPDAQRSTALARIIADYLIQISYPVNSSWPYFPPTYHGPRIGKNPASHMQLTNNFTIMGADAGNAYLDLYDFTRDARYLEAAKRLARTYLKTQLANGSWYLFANYQTGEPTVENITIPTAIVNYLDRLRKDYQVPGLEKATQQALTWIMENPVKTYNWQGQFEDVRGKKPYENQSREQACDLAIYLLKHSKEDKKNVALAEELIRFSEDQFVIWEKPLDFQVKKNDKNPGWDAKNWITPSVQEQHGFWMPVNRAAGIMIEAYWQAYQVTKKDIYVAKAKSIANAITVVQQANSGDYPTMFIRTPWTFWLNSVVYPAKVMMNLDNNIKKQGL